MFSKNVKNYIILITYLVGVLIVFIGVLLKVNNYSYAKFLLLLGLAFQLKSLFMFIYKYGYKLKQLLNK